MESLANAKRIEKVRLLWISMRPQQWYKNSLLLAGLFFARQSVSGADVLKAVLAFVCFCLYASGLYLINDVLDKKADSLHEIKKHRPIASGRLNSDVAIIAGYCLIATGFTFAKFVLGTPFFVASMVYVTLTFSYSFLWKRVEILDVFSIASGFVIRALAGCLVIGVRASSWLLICTFLLALILAISKRLVDNPQALVLEPLLLVTSAGALVSYSLFTFQEGHDLLLVTVPFAWFGVARYLYLVYQHRFGSRPELMFKDAPLAITLILWLVLFALIRHVFPPLILWV
jgi:4-hydroxybenzoate polyprenyltransferase